MRHLVLTLSLSLSLVGSSTTKAATPRPATSERAMAATAHPKATEAALSILQQGGNAVDGAIAAAFAISVVEPFSAGIGGGGFAVIFDQATKQTRALDFREKAPARATAGMYLDDKGAVVADRSVDGWLSVAVPGVVPGLAELHQKHGKLAWAKLLAPAIALADKGFVVGDDYTGSVQARLSALSAWPESQQVFFKPAGKGAPGQGFVPLENGDTLVQKDLGKTLRAIARNPRALNEGAIARTIASEMKAHGGLVDEADLKSYAPTWREPLCGPYKALTLCTMPPPSSGGVHVLEILRLLDDTDLRARGWHDVDGTHRLIEAMRIAFADRAVWLGDPAFVDVPVTALTSSSYARLRATEIDPQRARKSSAVKAATPVQLGLPAHTPVPPMKKNTHDSKDTSHLTVVDADRNAVSLTFTVNYGFGSGVVVKGTGILLNDEMDDFAAAPGVPNSYGLVGGEANAVAPFKIPLSSMTPLIATTKDGRFFLTAGAPGGSTIITTTLQTVLHVVDFGMDAQAAVSAPRIHQQWQPEQTRIERLGFDAPTQKLLEARGHTFDVRSHGWGNAMCIVQRDDGVLEGGADPRGEGTAAGL